MKVGVKKERIEEEMTWMRGRKREGEDGERKKERKGWRRSRVGEEQTDREERNEGGGNKEETELGRRRDKASNSLASGAP